MGAAGSKGAEGSVQEGIITVIPAAAASTHPAGQHSSRGPSPLPPPGSSRPNSRLSQVAVDSDPLLHHLEDLKAQGAKLDPLLLVAAGSSRGRGSTSSTTRERARAGSTAGGAGVVTAAAASRGAGGAGGGAAAAAEPDSLLADLAVAQQLSSDTQPLNAALTALVTDYQAWHAEHMRALTQNQDYITRTMDQAELKADKAVRHVQQQTTKLKQLSAGQVKAQQLPLLLQQLTAATEALEMQLHLLEQRADAVLVASASSASAAAAAAGGGGVSGSGAAAAGRAAAATSSSIGRGGGSGGSVGPARLTTSRTDSTTSSGGSRTGSFTSWFGGGAGMGLGKQQTPQQQQEQQQEEEQPQPSETAVPPQSTCPSLSLQPEQQQEQQQQEEQQTKGSE